MLSRRLARRTALQILFTNDFLRENIRDVASKVSESLEERVIPFTMDLAVITTEHEDELNDLIKKHLRNWDYQRVAVLDRVLIRMALCEMIHFPDIPVEVTINEALEISKDFSNLKSRKFVNGILDSIYKELKADNKLLKNIPVKVALNRKKQPQQKGNT
ncbi:MAG: transcription antitermination factor NusB [Calditrichia bacterium]